MQTLNYTINKNNNRLFIKPFGWNSYNPQLLFPRLCENTSGDNWTYLNINDYLLWLSLVKHYKHNWGSGTITLSIGSKQAGYVTQIEEASNGNRRSSSKSMRLSFDETLEIINKLMSLLILLCLIVVTIFWY